MVHHVETLALLAYTAVRVLVQSTTTTATITLRIEELGNSKPVLLAVRVPGHYNSSSTSVRSRTPRDKQANAIHWRRLLASVLAPLSPC